MSGTSPHGLLPEHGDEPECSHIIELELYILLIGIIIISEEEQWYYFPQLLLKCNLTNDDDNLSDDIEL